MPHHLHEFAFANLRGAIDIVSRHLKRFEKSCDVGPDRQLARARVTISSDGSGAVNVWICNPHDPNEPIESLFGNLFATERRLEADTTEELASTLLVDSICLAHPELTDA